MSIRQLIVVSWLASACQGSQPEARVSPSDHMPASVKSSSDARHRRLCVVLDGLLQQVHPVIDARSGDTLVMGRALRRSYGQGSSPYSADQEWAVQDEPMSIKGQILFENGLARLFQPADLRVFGEHRGIPVFIDAAAPDGRGSPPVLYTLENPDCMFQPYHLFSNARP